MNIKLARQLNHQKRMALGAAGTIKFRLPADLYKDLTNEQLLYLWGLRQKSEIISRQCEELADEITGFYARYGTERTKKDIVKRQEIQARINAGKWDEVSEAEYEFLYKSKTKKVKA